MPTRRTRIERERHGISDELLEAWRVGDWHRVNRLTGTKPWMISPFDAHRSDPRDTSHYGQSLPRALEWRKRLMMVAGPPGRMNMHGEPLGPAKPRKPKHADQS
jgi:hypothetical protein